MFFCRKKKMCCNLAVGPHLQIHSLFFLFEIHFLKNATHFSVASVDSAVRASPRFSVLLSSRPSAPVRQDSSAPGRQQRQPGGGSSAVPGRGQHRGPHPREYRAHAGLLFLFFFFSYFPFMSPLYQDKPAPRRRFQTYTHSPALKSYPGVIVHCCFL